MTTLTKRELRLKVADLKLELDYAKIVTRSLSKRLDSLYELMDEHKVPWRIGDQLKHEEII